MHTRFWRDSKFAKEKGRTCIERPLGDITVSRLKLPVLRKLCQVAKAFFMQMML